MTIYELRKTTRFMTGGNRVDTDLYENYDDAEEELENRIHYQTLMRNDIEVERWNDHVNLLVKEGDDYRPYIRYQIYTKTVK